MKKVLYISYDGMTDPLGQSQVIPYLKGLSSLGYSITILSFEKKARYAKQCDVIKSILAGIGIQWVPLFFTKKPPYLSKLYDVWRLKKTVLKLHKQYAFDFTHCRSYVSAGAGLLLKNRFSVPFLFDMRGFWVDERVDNGQWNLKNIFFKSLYKFYKRKEKVYFREAYHIISLTWKGRLELIDHYTVAAEKITVIPCCVDLDHFDYSQVTPGKIMETKSLLGLQQGNIVLTYLGSLGGWYLVNEMIDFFAQMKKSIPLSKFLFITHDDPAVIFKAAAMSGVDVADIIIRPASRNEVPILLATSDYSIFFIKDAYSKKASSPTKQGEIMAMGIPLVCNDIGDTGLIVDNTNAGWVVKAFSKDDYEQVIKNLVGDKLTSKAMIREGAVKYFDLSNGVSQYAGVYGMIVG